MVQKGTGRGAEDPSAQRHRPRNQMRIVAEEAAAHGVSVPAEPTDAERFLSPNDIAKILNVTGEAVKQWIYRRRLPAVKLTNGFWKVKVADFERYLRARREVARRCILVFAARPDGLDDILSAISGLGHEPLLSHGHADALLKAHDHMPALFIINLLQDNAEPWKLAEKVRSLKAIRRCPILLLAEAKLSEADTERAVGLAIQGVLTRPFQPEILSQEIARILQRTV
jgi:CheY-like chemotaxis protein